MCWLPSLVLKEGLSSAEAEDNQESWPTKSVFHFPQSDLESVTARVTVELTWGHDQLEDV